MTVVLLVMTHGRDTYLERTLASFDEMVSGGPVTRRVMHDDSADPAHTRRLQATYPEFHVITPPAARRRRRAGFGGSMVNAWQHVAQLDDVEWVFHLEDDFVFNRPVDLDDLIALSRAQPHLAQVALRRQPWGAEIPHGGFEYQQPDWYEERADGQHTWLETTRNFTTNPSLYRRRLCDHGWPTGQHSEGVIGFELRDRGLPWEVPGDLVRFGFAGGWDDGRRCVDHIGDDRAGGTGY